MRQFIQFNINTVNTFEAKFEPVSSGPQANMLTTMPCQFPLVIEGFQTDGQKVSLQTIG